MPTIEGIIFIPAGFFSFFFRPRFLFPLLIFSAVFQASTIVSFGTIGLQPYYFISILFILRFLILEMNRDSKVLRQYSFVKIWIVFAIFAAIATAVLPALFHGVRVFSPDFTIDANFLNPAHLSYRFGDALQVFLLFLNVLVVIAALKQVKNVALSHKAYRWSSYLVIVIVLLQVACFWRGIPFPTQLFNNNLAYGIVGMDADQLRPAGSFTEPSMAGGVLAAIAASYLWMYFAGKSNILRAGIAVVACLLIASSSSLLAIAIVVLIFLVANPVMRFPWFLRIGKLRRLSAFFISGAALSLLMLVPNIRNILLAQTVQKGTSWSALARLGADLFAFHLTLQTHGLGVGLGGNRPSSLVASLSSQVGVIGLCLFAYASYRTLWPLPKAYRWIGMAAITLLLSMAFGLPDLSFPFLWILFALAAQSRAVDALEAH